MRKQMSQETFQNIIKNLYEIRSIIIRFCTKKNVQY